MNQEPVKPPDPQEILDNTDGNGLCTFYADCNHTMNLMVANVPIKPKPLTSKWDINRNANYVIYNTDRNNSDTCIKYLFFVAAIYDVIRKPGQYISSMKLSHDHRYLYFNFREAVKVEEHEEWEDYLHLKENLQVNVIDLQTKQIMPDIVYEGHKGFSEYPAWYICLDTSDDIVASGSEEAKAYLWDRYHRCLITTLQHKEGVVNGLEFNPNDCETMVTSGDDHTIRIWRSRNRMKTLQPVDS
ncbi:F-box and WD-40 domain protein 5 [Mytilus galloprovincialis]|uniref:F-box and WD-40 domain protein 5 n=1 Tax=Mytilus galloprovincialis TaxID=29158 RepID=A0A8B6H5Z6_MYTGA|nr:F-box and WD-40 domain protein 5 [Mytilus galloprovincialis]